MVESARSGWRKALVEITTRRAVLGASLPGAAGLLIAEHDAEAKKKKGKGKKRCKNGAKRCGKGCCKAPSVCSAASCFCTGNEGNCRPIAQELIDIIADALGLPPEQVGANPDLPLPQCEKPGVTKASIDSIIQKDFDVAGQVPWCEGGINAGVEVILDRLKEKA